jgi:hypothetical protein
LAPPLIDTARVEVDTEVMFVVALWVLMLSCLAPLRSVALEEDELDDEEKTLGVRCRCCSCLGC